MQKRKKENAFYYLFSTSLCYSSKEVKVSGSDRKWLCNFTWPVLKSEGS